MTAAVFFCEICYTAWFTKKENLENHYRVAHKNDKNMIWVCKQ